MTTHSDNVQGWATGGGGEGDPALSSSDIQQNMNDVVSQFGQFTQYFGDIPDTASVRPNGVFFDPDDLMEYLQSGGLLFLNPDTGEPTPNPIVWIYQNVDPDTGEIEYEVYIDDESA